MKKELPLYALWLTGVVASLLSADIFAQVLPPPGPDALVCNSDVRLATSMHVNGDPLAAGSTGAGLSTLITFDYGETGILTSPVSALTSADVGATWGLGYNTVSQQLYASAFLKRHVGFGPHGPGAIYAFDSNSASPVANLLVDLSAEGVDVGSDTRVASVGAVDDPDELAVDVTQPSWDQSAYDLVGKMSLGDIDVSADGNILWAVSLKQRELVEVDISSGSATVTNQYAIPDPGCSDGEFRPWAVKVHDDRVWLGMVCSAETSQDANDLHAYIVAFDGTQFAPVFDFTLNYPKGQVGNGPTNVPWQPWTSTLQTLNTDPTFIIYPQPVLSDIEFDMDGSMILGFLDRTGHQVGANNYRPDPTAADTALVQAQTGGDIVRVCNDGGSYLLENNGTCGGVTTAGADNNQGTGGGEFYWGEMWDYNSFNSDGGYHKETVSGGLAFRAGSGEVVVSAMNPDSAASSGGIVWLDNTTGTRTVGHEGLQLYSGNEALSGYLGKANGMGDVELFCVGAAPVSLGNYVWYDQNMDGIQDANEAGVGRVQVALYDNATCNGASVANTTTTQTGWYEFNDLSAGQDYCVQFDVPTGWALSPADTGIDDTVDSDAVESGTAQQYLIENINLTTTDYSYDVGIYQAQCTPPVVRTGLQAQMPAYNSSPWHHPNAYNVEVGDLNLVGFCLEQPDADPIEGDTFTVSDADRQSLSATRVDYLTRLFVALGDNAVLSVVNEQFGSSTKSLDTVLRYLVYYYTDWNENFATVEQFIDGNSWTEAQKTAMKALAQLILDKTEGNNGQTQYPVLTVYWLHNQTDTGRQDLIVPANYVFPDDQCELPKLVDIALTKTADKVSARRGEQVIYTLTAMNNGPDDATGVQVRDLLPAGISHVSNNPEQGTYTPGDGLWDVGSLPAGMSVELTITATVD